MSDYNVISKLLINILGIKLDIYFSIGLSIYIVRITINIANESIWTLVSRYLILTVVIESYDNLYSVVID